MHSYRRLIPNILSLSRVPAAILFLVFYSDNDIADFWVAIVVAFVALASDFLDGYLARKWRVTTQIGYFLDGLGDKTFHFAVLLVILREGESSTLLIWLLIIREVILYALRALDDKLAENMKQLRQFSRYHALFIRLYFAAFFVFDWFKFAGQQISTVMIFGEIFGWVAVGLGYFAIARLIQKIVRES
jgi:CDP-diacylglycerol--glycerol-3-phosphate 3-phosphatidyltransferase